MARQHTRLPHLSSWEEGRGDNEQLRSVHILSLLCKKESDLALLFWLQPLQLAVLSEDFNDNDDEKRVLELAWRLHLLLLHCRLSDQQVHQQKHKYTKMSFKKLTTSKRFTSWWMGSGGTWEDATLSTHSTLPILVGYLHLYLHLYMFSNIPPCQSRAGGQAGCC